MLPINRKQNPGYPSVQAAEEMVYEYYSKNADFTPLNSGAINQTVNLNVSYESGFVITKHTFTDFTDPDTANTRITNEGTTAAPNITVLLINAGSGKQLMDSPTHILNLFGTAKFPFILPYPIYLYANSTLTVQLTNKVATAMNIRLTFHGYVGRNVNGSGQPR